MAALIHNIPELDRKGLRNFGLTMGFVVAGLFGVLLPWLFDFRYPNWPWLVCVVFVAVALLLPMSLRIFYKVWMRFGLAISKITTPLILGLVFFVMITPLALIRRIFASDPMRRNLDKDSESYRVESRVPTKEDLRRPF